MYKLAQTPNPTMNTIKKAAMGFNIFTITLETLGRYRVIKTPIPRGMIKHVQYTMIF